jgi:hypothetical protein
MKKTTLLLPLLAFIFAVGSAFTNSTKTEDLYFTTDGVHFQLINNLEEGDCVPGDFYCSYRVADGITTPDLDNPDDFVGLGESGFVWDEDGR